MDDDRKPRKQKKRDPEKPPAERRGFSQAKLKSELEKALRRELGAEPPESDHHPLTTLVSELTAATDTMPPEILAVAFTVMGVRLVKTALDAMETPQSVKLGEEIFGVISAVKGWTETYFRYRKGQAPGPRRGGGS